MCIISLRNDGFWDTFAKNINASCKKSKTRWYSDCENQMLGSKNPTISIDNIIVCVFYLF